MLIITIISQALLYLCLSLCIGTFIFSLVPNMKRPKITVSKSVLLVALAGILIFSFLPVLQVILFLSTRMEFIDSVQSVLFTFEIGKAWGVTLLITVICSLFVFIFNYNEKRRYGFIGVFLSFLIILTIGWSSHPSSIEPLWGFISDSLHLLAVSIWVGILIIVSWFSSNHENWLKFLNWFTPLAFLCFGVTIISGLLLMIYVVNYEDYINSWMIPYGQALLLKHLFIIPLIIFAIVNSIFIRRKLKQPVSFNPKPWAKAESIIILMIFSATAALSQQSPPKETTISAETVSPIFSMFYDGSVHPDLSIQLSLNFTSSLLLLLSILFFVLIVLSFIKKAHAALSLLLCILFVFCIYLSFMTGVA